MLLGQEGNLNWFLLNNQVLAGLTCSKMPQRSRLTEMTAGHLEMISK